MPEQIAIIYVIITVLSIILMLTSVLTERGLGPCFKIGIIFMMVAALIKYLGS